MPAKNKRKYWWSPDNIPEACPGTEEIRMTEDEALKYVGQTAFNYIGLREDLPQREFNKMNKRPRFLTWEEVETKLKSREWKKTHPALIKHGIHIPTYCADLEKEREERLAARRKFKKANEETLRLQRIRSMWSVEFNKARRKWEKDRARRFREARERARRGALNELPLDQEISLVTVRIWE